MKKILYIFAVSLVLFSCKKEYKSHSFMVHPLLEKSFTNGIWHIMVTDDTLQADLSDYTFNFDDDYSFLVSGTEKKYRGIWNVFTESGTDDAPATDAGFNLLFTANAPHAVEQLGHNYRILQCSKDKIELFNEDTPHPAKIVLYR